MNYKHQHVETIEGVTVVRLTDNALDELDEFTYPNPESMELIHEFSDAVRHSSCEIILDARKVERLNHASVALLTQFARVSKKANKQLTIQCQSTVMELLDLCRLGELARLTTE